jgi:hypothetical protein
MKTIKFLTLTIVLLLASAVLTYSKTEDSLKKEAIENLNKDIKKLFRGIPINELLCGEQECAVAVYFKVNDKGVVEIYHINGKNSKLVEYSKQIIASNEIKADNTVLNDEVYWIKIIFKDFSIR